MVRRTIGRRHEQPRHVRHLVVVPVVATALVRLDEDLQRRVGAGREDRRVPAGSTAACAGIAPSCKMRGPALQCADLMDPQPDDLVTDRVRLVRHLGEGAMGTVWVADHLTLHTQVAVKFISGRLGPNMAEAIERFRREASTAARIKSAHVVQTFDQGVTEGGVPFIVMELLVGESLGERLTRAGPLTLRETAVMLVHVAKALGAAHRLGIVHRDVKPDNIFLTNTDEGLFAKLFDFGLARPAELPEVGGLTHAGNLVGTPEYLNPEQLAGTADPDWRADLWALAVVAYVALTGRLPFRAETLGLLLVRLLDGTFKPPSRRRADLPAEVDAWFVRALARDPSQRFGSARELALAFAQLVPDGDDLLSAALGPTGRFSSPGAVLDSGRAWLAGRTPLGLAGMAAGESPQAAGPRRRWLRVALPAGAAVAILALAALLLTRGSAGGVAAGGPSAAPPPAARAGEPPSAASGIAAGATASAGAPASPGSTVTPALRPVVPEATAPQVLAGGRELHEEDVQVDVARALERAAAEVDRSPEAARHQDVARTVGRHGRGVVRTRRPVVLAPQVLAVRAELGEKGVRSAAGLVRLAAEAHGAVEQPGEQQVALRIDRRVEALLRAGIAKARAPLRAPLGTVELCREHVV
ncbi:MAG: serine/threonine protein kinase [Deltaproteobacteria bacterium]|nr:serine/threonine protein kinase [Deltaproteobacteria bacterium]